MTNEESVENLRSQVTHLLALCLPKLSLEDVTEVQGYVEHNELGLAAGSLQYIIETLSLAKSEPRIEPLALELAESLRKAGQGGPEEILPRISQSSGLTATLGS